MPSKAMRRRAKPNTFKHCISMRCKAKQHKTTPRNARPCHAMVSSAAKQCQTPPNQCQAMPGQGLHGQCRAMPSNVNRCQAAPGNVKECQALPNNAKQCQTMPSNAKQFQKAKQYETVSGNAEECPAKPINAMQRPAMTILIDANVCTTVMLSNVSHSHLPVRELSASTDLLRHFASSGLPTFWVGVWAGGILARR
eukprot:6908572-Pyramimonas_sp.AAC.1